MKRIRLGTRGSPLALWQARLAASRLEYAGGGPCEIVVIRTTGDRFPDAPLGQVGGKRVFVKEIEDALLAHEVDVAVHSVKDMPVILADGLALGAVLPRDDPRDALVLPGIQSEGAVSVEESRQRLGATPRIGTSSVRRIAQLRNLLTGARFQPVRGNLDTRLRKLDRGDHDALVLAAAGLFRLGLGNRVTACLPVEICVPAPGQGAIGLEVRSPDRSLCALVSSAGDQVALAEVEAERALVAGLGGGCQTPIGALATTAAEDLVLDAVVVSVDGKRVVRGQDRSRPSQAVALGTRLARRLIGEGAAEILDEVRRTQATSQG
jgi:hydroxymethylbilane synthase